MSNITHGGRAPEYIVSCWALPNKRYLGAQDKSCLNAQDKKYL